MWQKRQRRLEAYYQEEKIKWLPLSSRELFLAGLFLYWGEGTKSNKGLVNISNTDAMVIKFSLYWLLHCLKVPKHKIKILLHLYTDMDIQKEIEYWSSELYMGKTLFTKPYIKANKRSDLDEKGHGHGTCDIRVSNTILKEKIMMAIKVMGDHYAIELEKRFGII